MPYRKVKGNRLNIVKTDQLRVEKINNEVEVNNYGNQSRISRRNKRPVKFRII
jgi:hypothetical protein